MSQICSQYLDRPTVTNVITEPGTTYPDVKLCFPEWYDEAKLEERNITEGRLLYMTAFFQLSPELKKLMMSVINAGIRVRVGALESWLEGQLRAENSTRLVDYLNQIRRLGVVKGSTITGFDIPQVRTTWSLLGLCHTIGSTALLNAGAGNVANMAVKVNLTKAAMLSPESQVGIYCIDCESEYFPQLSMISTYSRYTEIKVGATAIRRKPGNKCKDYKNGRGWCFTECYEVLCPMPKSVALRQPLEVGEINADNFRQFANVLSLYRNTSTREYQRQIRCHTRSNVVASCAERCPPPCNETIYDTQIVATGGSGGNMSTTDWVFDFSRLGRMIVIEEQWMFNTLSFITAASATASLFFGASLWSFVQMVVFAVETVGQLWKGVDGRRVAEITPKY